MNQKGFAVSGIVYALMVLFIILVIALLSMFSSRKNTLDKLKDKVLNQIGSSTDVETKEYQGTINKEIHKITTKGYYNITLTSSNGSTLQTEIYLREGELLYLKVGSKTYNSGDTEIYTDSNYSNLFLKVTNDEFKAKNYYNDRSTVNTSYVKNNDTIGNGKITFEYLQRNRKNQNMNQIRYIKNCISGSSNNDYKWTEIKALAKGVNVAYNKEVKIFQGTNEITGEYGTINDNNLTTNYNFSTADYTGEICAVIDLERTYALDYINVWHDYDKETTYYDNKTYTSTAGIDYKLIDNYDGKENENGKTISTFESSVVKLVGGVYVPVKKFGGATWIRLYHHNNMNGTITWDALNQVLMENGYDTIHKKSILFYLSDYILDGKYELMLEYPDVSDTKYNRWTQTSDFTKEISVRNYVGIHIDYNDIRFKGLIFNNGINSIITTDDKIHYAIGTLNGGNVYGYNNNLIIGSTDLWVKINE